MNSLSETIKLLSFEPSTSLDDTMPEWGTITVSLRGQGLGGYVYANSSSILPAPVRNFLKIDWLAQSAKNLLAHRELEEIGRLCIDKKLRPALLKGFALLDDVYPSTGMRFASDIDIFVRPHERLAFESILFSMGYEPVLEVRWAANRHKFNWRRSISPTVEIDIEIHTCIFPEDQVVCWCWVPATIQGFQRLATEDLLVHLLGHLGYQHTLARLFWLVDIDNLLRRNSGLDWDRVFLLAAKLGHLRSASAGLWACRDTLKTPIPERQIGRYGPTWPWRILITPAFLFQPKKHVFRYYILKHLLRDKLADALLYDWRWLWRYA